MAIRRLSNRQKKTEKFQITFIRVIRNSSKSNFKFYSTYREFMKIKFEILKSKKYYVDKIRLSNRQKKTGKFQITFVRLY